MPKHVRLPSGHTVWRDKLRKVYRNLREFKAYCEIYGLHERLGYQTPETAWRFNPLIQGSVYPEDYKRVRDA